MKHILDYRGFTIFKISDKNYAIKMDTPDGMLPVGKPFKTCLEAVVAINRGLTPKAPKQGRIHKFLVDIFNISA